jgi:hypothetical protein
MGHAREKYMLNSFTCILNTNWHKCANPAILSIKIGDGEFCLWLPTSLYVCNFAVFLTAVLPYVTLPAGSTATNLTAKTQKNINKSVRRP